MKVNQDFIKHSCLLIVLSVVTALAWSCEEEGDGVVNYDPSISLVLYNMDSLTKEGGVEDTLRYIEDSLDRLSDTLSFFSDSASVLNDSILVLNQEIDDGDESLIETRDMLVEQRTVVNGYYAYYEERDSVMSAYDDFWSEVESNILNGKVLINSITNLSNDRVVSYKDSLTSWPIPLDMNADSSRLALVIDEEEYLLTVYYQRSIITNEYDEVLIECYGFSRDGIFQQGFDSLRLSCRGADCIDIETTIYAYF